MSWKFRSLKAERPRTPYNSRVECNCRLVRGGHDVMHICPWSMIMTRKIFIKKKKTALQNLAQWKLQRSGQHTELLLWGNRLLNKEINHCGTWAWGKIAKTRDSPASKSPRKQGGVVFIKVGGHSRYAAVVQLKTMPTRVTPICISAIITTGSSVLIVKLPHPVIMLWAFVTRKSRRSRYEYINW